MSILGNVAGLGAIQSDWAQTDEKRADFIRNKPDFEELSGSLEDLRVLAEAALPKSGGTMSGAIAMGDNKITGLGTPTADTDAATKAYVDGKHFELFATIPVSGWYNFVGSVYQNNVSVEGILATDKIDVDVFFLDHSAEAQETNLMLEEEFAKIFHIPYGDGVMWVRARELPTVDIPIKIKVVR